MNDDGTRAPTTVFARRERRTPDWARFIVWKTVGGERLRMGYVADEDALARMVDALGGDASGEPVDRSPPPKERLTVLDVTDEGDEP